MPDTPHFLEYAILTGAADLLSPAAFDLPEVKQCEVLAYLNITQSASDEFNQTDVHWNDTFMLQYTGGTTGKPKGAILSHPSVIHNSAQSKAVNPFEGDQ
jgi:long-chain acyl-CoA synthetase